MAVRNTFRKRCQCVGKGSVRRPIINLFQSQKHSKFIFTNKSKSCVFNKQICFKLSRNFTTVFRSIPSVGVLMSEKRGKKKEKFERKSEENTAGKRTDDQKRDRDLKKELGLRKKTGYELR